MHMNLSKLLEKVKDRKTWWAAVHGVTKSRTQLSTRITIEIAVAQNCDGTKCHWITHFKKTNFVLYKSYPIKKKKVTNWAASSLSTGKLDQSERLQNNSQKFPSLQNTPPYQSWGPDNLLQMPNQKPQMGPMVPKFEGVEDYLSELGWPRTETRLGTSVHIVSSLFESFFPPRVSF